MSRLIRVLHGVWSKSPIGEWQFDGDSSYTGCGVLVRENESFESLTNLVRERYALGDKTPIALTYQLPQWMREIDGHKTPPHNIISSPDVEKMMSVRAGNPELTLYVTSDPQRVAMHQSICRSDFPINFVDDVRTDEVERPLNEDDYIDIIEETDILGDISNKANELYIGMVFKDRVAFKQHMALHAINNKFRFRTSKSAPGGMVLNCISTTCRWRVYAVRLKNSDLFEIRTVEHVHTCSVDDRSGYQRQATHAIIGEMMRTRYAGPGGGPRPNEIIQVMRGDHDVHISYWKAWRAREVALDYAKGAGASYNLLPDYLNKLVRANPGTIAEIHTDHHENLGNQFKYMFLAMGASIKGYQYMRKVVVIDGTHLRGKYAGSLLTASAQDGNFRVFPLAIGVVDGENDKAWEWFFDKLKAIVPNNEETVFVSDRHASIYYGLAKVFPNARHCACILHLKRNIRTNFKDKHLGYLVGKAARAFKVSEFYSVFNDIRRINASCAEYLIGIGFEHWTRSHFPGNRYNIMTSNVAETLNSVLREAREYPILKLVEYIRAKLMSWFATRRAEGTSGQESLTPRVLEILTVNFESSGSYVVNMINASEYDVRDKSGASYHVDLARKICSCFIFQMLKIPCSHAVAAAVRSNVRVDSLVAVEYSMASIAAAYENSIAPVTVGEYISEHVADMSSMNMVPPSSRRPPGRPRKNRYFSRGEIRMKTPRKRTMCSRCKGCGHNRATCKMAI